MVTRLQCLFADLKPCWNLAWHGRCGLAATLDHFRRLEADEGGLRLGLEQRQMWRGQ